MVHLSSLFFVLATLAVGFASPYMKRDDSLVVQGMDCITQQLIALEQYALNISANSTIDDVQCLLDGLDVISSDLDTTTVNTADAGEFTPSTASDVVNKLHEMEPEILSIMYYLIQIKMYLDPLGFTHRTKESIDQFRAMFIEFSDTVLANVQDYLKDEWLSMAVPCERMCSQASVAYSAH